MSRYRLTTLFPLIFLTVVARRSAAEPVAFASDDIGALPKEAKYVTAVCGDDRGCLWVGSEGGGVRRFDPAAKGDSRWSAFGGKDGLGDEFVCALAVDRRGRVWAGHLNHGVSVYNGSAWKNYDLLAGPLGEHVVKIRVCPTTGDVWMATNAGLSRYSESTDRWTSFTRADGLPSDATNCLAFDADGNVVVGTEADGLAMADAADGYQHWRTVTGPDGLTPTATGAGLPTGQINDLTITTDGIIYVATNNGLGWSADHGRSWKFSHGPEWVERMHGSLAGPPKNWVEPAPPVLGCDAINALSRDGSGLIYLAYSQTGLGAFLHGTDGSPVAAAAGDLPDSPADIGALPPEMNGYKIAGSYGDGLVPLTSEVKVTTAAAGEPPALPTAATGGSASDMAALAAALPKAPETGGPVAITLEDDWRTQGTWDGRYGRDWAYFPGIDLPQYCWGAGAQATRFHPYTGPHRGVRDAPRYYITALYSDDVRVLEIPPIYMDSRLQKKLTTPDRDRRLGEINDNGDARQRQFEGPSLYYDLGIPAGTFVLSIYELNNDGHPAANASRDYSMEIRLGRGSYDAMNTSPVVAGSRVVNFYNGVYKRFLVTGPADLTLGVLRNYSPNVKLSALALDRPTEVPASHFDRQPARPAAGTTPAGKIATALQEGFETNPKWWALNHRRLAVLLARWCQTQPPSDDLSWIEATALYHAGLFAAMEQTQSELQLRTARDIEKSMVWTHRHNDSSGFEARDLKEYLDAHPGK